MPQLKITIPEDNSKALIKAFNKRMGMLEKVLRQKPLRKKKKKDPTLKVQDTRIKNLEKNTSALLQALKETNRGNIVNTTTIIKAGPAVVPSPS